MINNKLKFSGGGGINCQNKLIFTYNGSFIVPEGVSQIRVSGCAAGGDGIANKLGDSGFGLAGEFVIDKLLAVTPKEVIDITVGKGNTIIGTYLTLIANSAKVDCECHKLGFKTGIAGTRYSDVDTGNGYSGAFGFGGGNGLYSYYHSSSASGIKKAGKSLGCYYGDIVSLGGEKIGTDALDSYSGKPGKVYGSGAGGGVVPISDYAKTGGGGAGGYGAGGGAPGGYGNSYGMYYGNPGQGTPGIVIIEW